MKPIRIRFILPAILAVLASQRCLQAHAMADHSEPRVGSQLSRPPTLVKIWFTQEVEPAFSRIQVFGSDGKEVDKKDTHVDPQDHHVLMVSLTPLPPGTYRVHWQVVSVDTHRTQNDFKFVVKP
jgi:methionine-rich copper-binding protein CopC